MHITFQAHGESDEQTQVRNLSYLSQDARDKHGLAIKRVVESRMLAKNDLWPRRALARAELGAVNV